MESTLVRKSPGSGLFDSIISDWVKPYAFHAATTVAIVGMLFLDVHTSSLAQQYWLGVITWAFLIVATRFSPPHERRQVWILVGIATLVEVTASIGMGMYRYRFGNLPMYVPPGHGIVYLYALRFARTPVMFKYGKQMKWLAFAAATTWALIGVTLSPAIAHRPDIMGAMMLPYFAFFLTRRNGGVFVGAFIITSILELFGTGFGNWVWAAHSPIMGIPVGNPPSVIAGGYCMMDYATLKIAGRLPDHALLPDMLRSARRQLRIRAGRGVVAVPASADQSPVVGAE